MSIDYWRECLSSAADESGFTLTAEQLDTLASAAENAHENYSMAFYSPPAGEYLEVENAKLRRELDKERNKIICPACKGQKTLVSIGFSHNSYSQCWRCDGKGTINL